MDGAPDPGPDDDSHGDARAGRATIRDVSRIAGVSIKTVSRVINKERYVGAATRERIERAMAELRFQPNFAARALAGRRSHQIALICDNPNPWYVYEVQYGTRARCQQDGVRMIAQPFDRGSPTLLADVVALIDQGHPDGLILTPPACDDRRVLDELARRRIPFVRVQPGSDPEASPSVSIDNRQAGRDMTGHLLALGHRRVGFLTGDPGYAASGERLEGHRAALREAGVAVDAELIRPGRFDAASGGAATAALLALADPPTAIFASSDDMAAGALATAHRLGVAVPGTLSIAGFDDSATATIVWPPLTTIRQPVRRLAELAADLLLSPDAEPHRRVAHELVVRDSTAPPGV